MKSTILTEDIYQIRMIEINVRNVLITYTRELKTFCVKKQHGQL